MPATLKIGGREYYSDVVLVGEISGAGTLDLPATTTKKCKGFLIEAGGLHSGSLRNSANQDIFDVVMTADGDLTMIPISGNLADDYTVSTGAGTSKVYLLF